MRGDVALIASDRRETHQVLASLTDAMDAEHAELVAKLLEQRAFGFPGVFAEQVIGRAELQHAFGDEQVQPAPGPALNDDAVVAVLLQIGAEETVGLGGAEQIRHRAFGNG